MLTLPGGGAMAFDLDNLTLADYRQMKSHYQINSSLSVLTFMLHQMEWHLEGGDAATRSFITDQIETIWSRLVRAKSQALWAGYSPNVIQWENDVDGKKIIVDKIKDLLPEDCKVHWKRIDSPGSTKENPQSFKVYDGIDQFGSRTIPVGNSYWYPLLMRNGNYYGEQLLKSAFQPWFFSMLMHLFANRYYERFGEPIPVGRAPFEETLNVNGENVKGNQAMASIMTQLRNRSIVILPNDKTQWGEETTLDYDYQLEYLESQMRGADFERYMTRLDEEISLALFTPILMMRTADVGSYNLGQQHTQVYLWMLNAISGDWAEYINKYLIRPLNFHNSARGVNAEPVKLKFAKMGKVQAEMLQSIVAALLKNDKIKFDVAELGEAMGLSIKEVRNVTVLDPAPAADPNAAPAAGAGNQQSAGARTDPHVRAVGEEIINRLKPQVEKAFRNDTFGVSFEPSMGYQRRMEEAMAEDDVLNYDDECIQFYAYMNRWLGVAASLGRDEFANAEQFVRLFSDMLNNAIDRIRS